MPTASKFNCFTADLANKVHNLASDTFKICLTDVAPVATNTQFSNLTEITAQNGYSAGGFSCTVTSAAQASGVLKWLVQQPTLTATGTVGPFRYAALYNNTSTNKSLIMWWDYGSEVTMVNGDTFTVGFDQSGGVLTIT